MFTYLLIYNSVKYFYLFLNKTNYTKQKVYKNFIRVKLWAWDWTRDQNLITYHDRVITGLDTCPILIMCRDRIIDSIH